MVLKIGLYEFIFKMFGKIITFSKQRNIYIHIYIGYIRFVAFKNFRRANPCELKYMCSSEPPTGH